MTRRASSESRMVCRSCSELPRVRVTHAESHRLPKTWRPIDEHPELRAGPWVPRGEMKGIVFCDACGVLWFLFLDPGQSYYTDVIEMAPELAALVSEDATLEDVLPVAVSGDSLLQLMIRDWFALADHDPSESAAALTEVLARPELPAQLAVRILDFLGAVLAGAGRGRTVEVPDASPLADLLSRDDLVSLDETRLATERNEIRRLVAGLARAAFGTAFGADRDRMQTDPSVRERLLAVTHRPRPRKGPPVLAPPAHLFESPEPEGVEHLVGEIEELLRDGASRVMAEEIAPILAVVQNFWDVESDEPVFAPGIEPSLVLYQRCRDLLFALRQADLIPSESESAVAAALAVPVAQLL
jgi:hypothetical protein